MRILVLGAHGQIGKILVKKLQQSSFEVVCGLRSQKQAEDYQAQGYNSVLVDVEKDMEQLQKAMQDI